MLEPVNDWICPVVTPFHWSQAGPRERITDMARCRRVETHEQLMFCQARGKFIAFLMPCSQTEFPSVASKNQGGCFSYLNAFLVGPRKPKGKRRAQRLPEKPSSPDFRTVFLGLKRTPGSQGEARGARGARGDRGGAHSAPAQAGGACRTPHVFFTAKQGATCAVAPKSRHKV